MLAIAPPVEIDGPRYHFGYGTGVSTELWRDDVRIIRMVKIIGHHSRSSVLMAAAGCDDYECARVVSVASHLGTER